METILIPLDGSPFSEHALPVALAIARRGAMRLALVHVHRAQLPTVSSTGVLYSDPAIDTIARDQEAAYLERVAQSLASVWDGSVAQALLEAPITDALCQHAQALGAALIVLSSHGRGGVAQTWLGSVTDRLLRLAPAPLLVVRPGDNAPDLTREPALRRILIPLDGSALAEHAIDLAVWLGQPAGAHYTLLRVIEPITRSFLIEGAEPEINVEAQAAAYRHAADELERVADRLRGEGLSVTADTCVGQPAAKILEAAITHYSHLIAMASHGRGGISRLLIGSVADKVLCGANVPVLVSRAHINT